jgi:hypothetical protein
LNPLTLSPTLSLIPAQHYAVKIKGTRCRRRRIFKWAETRVRAIPRFVFTSPVHPAVTTTWDGETFTVAGNRHRCPNSEFSIPHYDLETCAPLI